MLPLSLLFKKFLYLGATAYGGPAIAGQMKKVIVKDCGWIKEQGILAAFVGMLGLVLYNFARTTFVDIPSVIFAAVAFMALLKKVELSHILSIGAVLSILLFGFLL